jgi:acyl-CoA thioester hydrolase
MPDPTHTLEFRIRYSETDQMGSYYNSRALEWFEHGRVELVRSLGMSYREMESRGVLLPVTEAHVNFLDRAEYDDLLRMTSTLSMPSRARIRFDVAIEHAEKGHAVCAGWTVHAVTDPSGKPIRPPPWLLGLIRSGTA